MNIRYVSDIFNKTYTDIKYGAHENNGYIMSYDNAQPKLITNIQQMRSPKFMCLTSGYSGGQKPSLAAIKLPNTISHDEIRITLSSPPLKLVRVNWGLNTIFRADAF